MGNLINQLYNFKGEFGEPSSPIFLYLLYCALDSGFIF